MYFEVMLNLMFAQSLYDEYARMHGIIRKLHTTNNKTTHRPIRLFTLARSLLMYHLFILHKLKHKFFKNAHQMYSNHSGSFEKDEIPGKKSATKKPNNHHGWNRDKRAIALHRSDGL